MTEIFRFHHIAVATSSAEKTMEFYKKLGFKCTEVIDDPLQNVKISFLSREGHPRIELVEPMSETSPVSAILKKTGTTPYHFCYEVDNMQEAIAYLKKEKFIQLGPPVHAKAIDGKMICFLFSPDIGLIELLQYNKTE